MKKLIPLIVLITLVYNTIAQNTNFRSQMNAIFENVDLSQVLSGILSDYSFDELFKNKMGFVRLQRMFDKIRMVKYRIETF